MNAGFGHSPLSACCSLFPSVRGGFPSGAHASLPQPAAVSARGPPRWLLLTDLCSAASPAAFWWTHPVHLRSVSGSQCAAPSPPRFSAAGTAPWPGARARRAAAGSSPLSALPPRARCSCCCCPAGTAGSGPSGSAARPGEPGWSSACAARTKKYSQRIPSTGEIKETAWATSDLQPRGNYKAEDQGFKAELRWNWFILQKVQVPPRMSGWGCWTLRIVLLEWLFHLHQLERVTASNRKMSAASRNLCQYPSKCSPAL